MSIEKLDQLTCRFRVFFEYNVIIDDNVSLAFGITVDFITTVNIVRQRIHVVCVWALTFLGGKGSGGGFRGAYLNGQIIDRHELCTHACVCVVCVCVRVRVHLLFSTFYRK